jgi:hypothetical protein
MLSQKELDYAKCLSKLEVGDIVSIGLDQWLNPSSIDSYRYMVDVVVLYQNWKNVGLVNRYREYCDNKPILLGCSGRVGRFWQPTLSVRQIYNIKQI